MRIETCCGRPTTVAARFYAKVITHICINKETRFYDNTVPNTLHVERSTRDSNLTLPYVQSITQKAVGVQSQVILSMWKEALGIRIRRPLMFSQQRKKPSESNPKWFCPRGKKHLGFKFDVPLCSVNNVKSRQSSIPSDSVHVESVWYCVVRKWTCFIYANAFAVESASAYTRQKLCNAYCRSTISFIVFLDLLR